MTGEKEGAGVLSPPLLLCYLGFVRLYSLRNKLS